MLRQLIKYALRSLRKTGLLNGISLVGLTLGLAAFFIISLYLYQENTYEKDFANRDRVYQVGMHFLNGGPITRTSSNLPYSLDKIPEVEVYSTWRKAVGTRIFVQDSEFTKLKVLSADSNFYKIFDFDFLEGDHKRALREPNTAIISAKAAKTLFGDEDPIGKELSINKTRTVIVNGVTKDPHFRTQMEYDIILSRSRRGPFQFFRWASAFDYTYVLLKPGVDQEIFDQKLADISKNEIHVGYQEQFGEDMESFEEWKNSTQYLGFFSERFSELYFGSIASGKIGPTANTDQNKALRWVSMFILLISFLNFINITTARSSNRLKEVGIKRVLGSNRRWLMSQFMLETFMIVLFSSVLAVGITELFTLIEAGLFSNLLDYSVMHSSELLLMLVLFIPGLSLIAGIYPALYLSSANHLSLLKKGVHGGFMNFMNVVWIRKGSVVVQFTCSTILIIGVLTIFLQIDHLKTRDLGLKADGLLVIDNPFRLKESNETFKDELLRQGFVSAASFTSRVPYRVKEERHMKMEYKKGEWIEPRYFSVDPDFFEVMNIEIKEGTGFSVELQDVVKPENVFESSVTPSHREDQKYAEVIINRTAQRMMQLEDPVGQIIDFNLKIIGVVDDFIYHDLRSAVGPVILSMRKKQSRFNDLIIKTPLTSENIERIESIWSQFTGDQMEYFRLDDSYDELIEEERQSERIFASFSLLAIFISSLGLFSLAVFSADQRRQEFGIRKVLGASIQDIIKLFSIGFVRLVLLSFIIAIPIANYAVGEWLETFADRIDLSVWVYILAAAIGLVLSILVLSVQSIKTGRLNPVDTLRNE